MTNINFDLLKGKSIDIYNHKNDGIIEIRMKQSTREDFSRSLWLDYSEFVALIDTIQSIGIDRVLKLENK